MTFDTQMTLALLQELLLALRATGPGIQGLAVSRHRTARKACCQ